MALDSELPSTQWKKVKLSGFRGQKNVVLAFFPAAFTGGCTKEMSGTRPISPSSRALTKDFRGIWCSHA